jgi:phosphatidylglycerophosphate synthase
MEVPNIKKKKFQRASDSFLTHLFARSVSVYLTPVIAKTTVTPLQVTIVGLILGLISAYVGSYPWWICGIFAAIMIEISHILDCVDGELARLTGRGSPFAACLDPISDRVKDMAIIFSAFLQTEYAKPFNLSEFQISLIAFLALGLWFLYMYIVDAFLNPARERKKQKIVEQKTTIYIGLYDLFIYGCILFWLLNIFEYFIFYVFCLSVTGLPIQIVRLKHVK